MTTRDILESRIPFLRNAAMMERFMDLSGCKECLKLYPWDQRIAPTARLAKWELMFKHWDTHSKKDKSYAFTFTTGAKADDFARVEDELVEAALKLFRQESVPLKEGEAYLEYGEDGRPHVHGWYKTTDGGRIFSKVFHRAWPEWAEKRGKTKFAGGYHEEMKSDRYVGYANSEGRLVASVKKSAQ